MHGPSCSNVGEYSLGNVIVYILRLGSPELHECSECDFQGGDSQMLVHVQDKHSDMIMGPIK